MAEKEKKPEAPSVSPANPIVLRCGIVMPISAMDGCPAEHWAEVLSILKDAIQPTGFEATLVSDADDVGIIQKRIVQNIYNNEVVVCDVSGKNPNVMFELGLRLAFDKPTIIIKDDKTDYSFDTSIIEHLTYPRDLRFSRIVEFRSNLTKKIAATYKRSQDDPNHSTFLKSFGEYRIASLERKELTSDEFILSSLEELRAEVRQLRLQRDLPTKTRRTRAIAVDLLKEKLNEFLLARGISKSTGTEVEKEAFISFAEDLHEVRQACGTPDILREIVNLFYGDLENK